MVSAEQQALALLGQADAAMVDVLQSLTVLDRSADPFRSLKVGIAANITVDLLATYLRRHAYRAGVRLQVAKGSYDDLVGDAQAHAAGGVGLLLILPFFDNLQPSWESQLSALADTARDAVHADYFNRLELALQATQGVSLVLVMGAHWWNPPPAQDSAQQLALQAFNAGLQQVVGRHPQARFVETLDLVVAMGTRQAFDARFYFRAKMPYTAGFTDQLARRVAMATRGFGSAFHKVLVLDCDNTLWGGIVGEDGPSGIQLDRYSCPGNIFWTVQQQFRELEAQGVLLCLCSKNNQTDVDEVLQGHEAMVLRDAQLVAKRVNWDDKPSNMRALASQLNLGLESFVFVDDSAFEVQAVREQLPQVTVFQVPKALQDYPALVREQIVPLFLAGGVSQESRGKTQQYRGLAQAAELRSGFASQEDYLRSLAVVVTLRRNDLTQVARIAELIGKSNQFNLTTQRLSAGEVAALMSQDGVTVYSFAVTDRLADHGLAGVLITVGEGDAVRVHSFLMSCRVIGRGAEFAVWRTVVNDALSLGKRHLLAAYRPTAKNAQVADFYDRLGLHGSDEVGDGSRSYTVQLEQFQLPPTTGVELRNA